MLLQQHIGFFIYVNLLFLKIILYKYMQKYEILIFFDNIFVKHKYTLNIHLKTLIK